MIKHLLYKAKTVTVKGVKKRVKVEVKYHSEANDDIKYYTYFIDDTKYPTVKTTSEKKYDKYFQRDMLNGVTYTCNEDLIGKGQYNIANKTIIEYLLNTYN